MLTSDTSKLVSLLTLLIAYIVGTTLVNGSASHDVVLTKTRRSRLVLLKKALSSLQSGLPPRLHHRFTDLLTPRREYEEEVEPQKRTSSGDMMEHVRFFYKTYYDKMQPFIADLPTQYNSQAPACLQNVPVIAKIITPNDPAFVYNQPKKVYNRTMVVITMTKLVMQYTDRFVKPEYASSFTTKCTDVALYAGLLEISLQGLRVTDGAKEVDVVMGGIGDLNTGVDSGLSQETWFTIKDVLDCLRNLMKSGKK